jgi:hypothetical protein
MVLQKFAHYGRRIMFFAAISLCLNPTLEASETKDQTIQVADLQATPLFKKFMKTKGQKLSDFQGQHLPRVETVFYPFGGPDLLYPLSLFPDAKTIVMVGLEYPGRKLTAATRDSAYEKINSLLVRGFFVTAKMHKSLNEKVGVRAALALEILLMGGTILEDKLIDPYTCSITFELNGQEKVVHYLRRNLVDHSDSVFEFLQEQGVNGACMMKSTSYSPHRKMFEPLKEGILKTFQVIVQDDSGIPLRDLNDFTVQTHGHYTKPYGVEWRGYEQNDLKELFSNNEKSSSLDFCYGYGCAKVEANILVATRKEEQIG